MDDLPEDLRALVAAEREASGLDGAQKARVAGRLAATIAAGASVGTASAAVMAGAKTAAGLTAAKVTVLAVVGVVAGVASYATMTYLARNVREGHRPVPSVGSGRERILSQAPGPRSSSAPAATVPAPSFVPAAVRPTVASLPARAHAHHGSMNELDEPAPGAGVSSPGAPPAAPATKPLPVVAPPVATPAAVARAVAEPPAPMLDAGARASQLGAENQVLEVARGELRRGAPAEALATCERHARTFARPILVEERVAIEIQALVQQGRRDEAVRRADDFRARFPRSIQRAAIEAALGREP